jgi:hypothetical protein
MPMFIPKRVVYLSSSIAHYERWFLMRADFVAPPSASEPRPHLTRLDEKAGGAERVGVWVNSWPYERTGRTQ